MSCVATCHSEATGVKIINQFKLSSVDQIWIYCLKRALSLPMTRLRVYSYSNLNVLFTVVDSAAGSFYMSVCHLIFSHSWHRKGLTSIGTCVPMSLSVTFYLVYMFLAFLCFLIKFSERTYMRCGTLARHTYHTLAQEGHLSPTWL